ncbi:MAG TPA: hypothetical protein VM925_26215 [Labilithrix sp.]|jgi:hypothetical protein|nr:hypothetical protein [Labilithrix sp.]
MRTLSALLLASALSLVSPAAAAWYFPEHVRITRDASAQLAPEVRGILQNAVLRARADGLPFCSDVTIGLENVPRTRSLTTRMIVAEKGADCVPYAALPALGGDHADNAAELRRVLLSHKAIEITTAAVHAWLRFLRAVEKLPNTPLERMAFVHELDVDFYFIDPGYELRAQASRAHFVDAGRSLVDVVRRAGASGVVGNAYAQFLLHHLRSLQVAAQGEASEALLEHGIALHFLEDAFSSGHLVLTEALWARGNTRTRHRHDYFDAKGIGVRRALAVEPCAELEQSSENGLAPCWATTGDGQLGLTADASDRVHAARAVEKVQIELALALDPERMVQFVEALGAREQIAFADLLDPAPWWTLPRKARRQRSANARHAVELVRAARAAIELLREGRTLAPLDVTVQSVPGALDTDAIERALQPCVERTSAAEGEADDKDGDGCGDGRHIALGTIGVSLLRPLLVELPIANADVSKLEGEAPTDHGVAFQLNASTTANIVFPHDAPIDFFLPALGVSMGLAYRFGTYLPGRRNRSGVELNAGFSAALHYNGDGRSGRSSTVTMLEQELRWPILWELLTSYVLPFDLRESHTAGTFIFLGGARVREMLTDPTPRLWGIELELAALALSSGSGAYPLYTASPEIRLHVGFADPSAAQPALPKTWVPTIGLTFTGGYATFL